jgi:hypothetical protein
MRVVGKVKINSSQNCQPLRVGVQVQNTLTFSTISTRTQSKKSISEIRIGLAEAPVMFFNKH